MMGTKNNATLEMPNMSGGFHIGKMPNSSPQNKARMKCEE
jgi:hypothetical protein